MQKRKNLASSSKVRMTELFSLKNPFYICDVHVSLASVHTNEYGLGRLAPSFFKNYLYCDKLVLHFYFQFLRDYSNLVFFIQRDFDLMFCYTY